MTTNNRRIVRIAGLLLILVAAVHMVLAIGGSGRELAGRLFFPTDDVAQAMAGAGEHLAPFLSVCSDAALEERFDSRAVKKFRKWCGAVERFATKPTAPTAVGLLRANNLHLERVVDKLITAGGEPAGHATAILAANCALKPQLEEVGNQVAGASLSQFLVGLFLLVPGILGVRRGRRLEAGGRR